MSKKLTREEILERVYNTFGESFVYEEQEYKNANTPIKLKCAKCGYLKSITMNAIVSSKQTDCRQCLGFIPYSTKEMGEKISQMTKGEYELISEYKSAHKYITVRHNSSECDYNEYSVKWGNFRKGTRCPKCAKRIGGQKITASSGWKERFLEELKRRDYQIVSPTIKRKKDKVLINNTNCEHEPFMMSPDKFMTRNQGCPKCNRSTGEERIENFLIDNKMPYEPQYSFEDLSFIRKLKFDFAVKDHCNKIIFLIEFDGEQHFRPVDFFGGEENFILLKERDRLKEEYCRDNNIPLIIIPYWEFENIEKILEEELKKYRNK